MDHKKHIFVTISANTPMPAEALEAAQQYANKIAHAMGTAPAKIRVDTDGSNITFLIIDSITYTPAPPANPNKRANQCGMPHPEDQSACTLNFGHDGEHADTDGTWHDKH